MESHHGFNNLTTAVHGGRLPFIQKVYGLLLASVLWAIACGAFMFQTPLTQVQTADGALSIPVGIYFMLNTGMLWWLVLFGLLFLARFLGRNAILGGLLLFGWTGLAGAWIAPNVWYVGVMQGAPQLVGLAGALTTLMFVTLSVYTLLSKKNFNFLGAGITVAFIGIIGAGLLNALFFHSGWAMTMISWAILVFASACVLYDTSRIARDYPEDAYVMATLALFVDLLNMFMAILSLLSGSRR